MRSIKELLILLLSEIENKKEIRGLCTSIKYLGLDIDDRIRLKKYIQEYLMINFKNEFRYFDDCKEGKKIDKYEKISGYVFPIGEKEPRIKWLKEHIELN